MRNGEKLGAGLLVQSKGQIVSDMNGQKVMLSIRNGKYYHLGQLGSVIWEKLASPTTAAQVAAALTEEYAVEPDVCSAQVDAFIQQLLEEGLIESGEGK